MASNTEIARSMHWRANRSWAAARAAAWRTTALAAACLHGVAVSAIDIFFPDRAKQLWTSSVLGEDELGVSWSQLESAKRVIRALVTLQRQPARATAAPALAPPCAALQHEHAAAQQHGGPTSPVAHAARPPASAAGP